MIAALCGRNIKINRGETNCILILSTYRVGALKYKMANDAARKWFCAAKATTAEQTNCETFIRTGKK